MSPPFGKLFSPRSMGKCYPIGIRHYWIQVLGRVPRQRPNCTRQSLCRVRNSVKNTRQKIDWQRSLCRVSFIGHSAKKSDCHGAGPVDGGFAECQPCRHSAMIFFIFFKKILCRVPPGRRSAKFDFFLPSALWPALGKV